MKLDMAEWWFRSVAANPDGSDTHAAFALVVAELDRMREELAALPEWSCPSCGATTRARMADHGEVDR